MEIKKIVFIEPKAQNLHIYTKFELPRLGNVLLATLARNMGYEVEVLFVDEQDVYDANIECDIIALSTITTTAASAFRIGDYFKERNIPVVIGGPHVSFLPEEALEHADFCIIGEGEKPFIKLLDTLRLSLPVSVVPNLVYWEDGIIKYNDQDAPECDLDSLPIPDLTLINRNKKGKKRGLLQNIIPIQTSRGCPFNCTFCSVTSMFGKHYRFRSTEKIIQEMQQYDPEKSSIFFYDDNFAANRRHTKELLQAIIKLPVRFNWSTQVRTDIAKDPELLDLMYEAGCRIVFIGLESVDPKALKEMKKSQTAEEIKYAIKTIRAKGIFVHGMFVFGFDADTHETIESTVNFAIEQKVDSVQFLILTPLPGTPLYYKLKQEGRLIHQEWEKYDAHHVASQPNHMTAIELQNEQIKAHSRFYSLKNVFKKLLEGNLAGFFVGIYAHRLNKKWIKKEDQYLLRLRNLLLERSVVRNAKELVPTAF